MEKLELGTLIRWAHTAGLVSRLPLMQYSCCVKRLCLIKHGPCLDSIRRLPT